jgi:hypothetical protein
MAQSAQAQASREQGAAALSAEPAAAAVHGPGGPDVTSVRWVLSPERRLCVGVDRRWREREREH